MSAHRRDRRVEDGVVWILAGVGALILGLIALFVVLVVL